MHSWEEALRGRLRHASRGRVARGTVIVLGSMLLLPTALWLIVLVAVMASRPGDGGGPTPPSIHRPALRAWITVASVFVGAVVLSALRKPLTGHGVQLLLWFCLLPAIGVAFWAGGRRAHTTAAVWFGTTIGACTAGSVAVVQIVLLDQPRAEGLVANSITFGNLALLMGALSIALHRLVRLPGRAAFWASSIAGVSGLMAGMLSGSRGGWLAVPLMVGLLLWQAHDELTPTRLARAALVMVATVSICNALSDGMLTSRASASVTNVSGYAHSKEDPPTDETPVTAAGSSEGARLEAWRSSGTAFRERPISGIGWGNLGTRFDRDAELGHRHERIATFEHAHNQLIGAAASGGAIGVASLLALFVVPLRRFARAARSRDQRLQALGVSGIIVIGSFAVFGLTEAILENLVPVTFLAVVTAALCAELDAAGRVTHHEQPAVSTAHGSRRRRRTSFAVPTRSPRSAGVDRVIAVLPPSFRGLR